MIKYFEVLPEDALNSLPENSVKTRIEGIYKAYGGSFPFLDFWLQLKGEKITAALCKFESELWLAANEYADFSEIAEFCPVVVKGVLTEKSIAEKCGFGIKTKFSEMVYNNIYTFKTEDESFDISAAYDLLKTVGGNIEMGERDYFYADISRRIRQGAAKGVLTENAVAIAGFIGKNSALISGVGVKKENRRSGGGSNALKRLIGSINAERIYAEATENTVGFYLKNGFLKNSTLCRCEF